MDLLQRSPTRGPKVRLTRVCLECRTQRTFCGSTSEAWYELTDWLSRHELRSHAGHSVAGLTLQGDQQLTYQPRWGATLAPGTIVDLGGFDLPLREAVLLAYLRSDGDVVGVVRHRVGSATLQLPLRILRGAQRRELRAAAQRRAQAQRQGLPRPPLRRHPFGRSSMSAAA